MHTLLKSGGLGRCPEQLANFEAECRKLHPLATAFKVLQEEPSPTTTTATMENHLDCQKQVENETERPVESASQTENSPPKAKEQLEHTETVTNDTENN